jgi:hypothetical protein
LSRDDYYDRRRDDERYWETRRDRRDADRKRQEYVSRMNRSMSDNPEALRILHGDRDNSLIGKIAGSQSVPRLAGLTVTQLRFFSVNELESVPDIPYRVFKYSFDRFLTHFVYFQVDLKNNLYGIENRYYRIEARYFNSSEVMLGARMTVIEVPSELHTAFYHDGRKDTLGFWKKGRYRLDLLIDDVKSGSEYFHIE